MISYVICAQCKHYSEHDTFEDACMYADIHNNQLHQKKPVANSGIYSTQPIEYYISWHPHYWEIKAKKCECGEIAVAFKDHIGWCKKHNPL